MTTSSRFFSTRRPNSWDRTGLAALFILISSNLPACQSASEDSRECNVHADCASGVCLPNGQCEPPVSVTPDSGTTDALEEVSEASDDVVDALEEKQEEHEDSSPTGCKPNGDGTITASEMPLGPNLSAMFRISNDVAYPSSPNCASGTCEWDLIELGGVTTEAASATLPLEGTWYAQLKGFETATYAARMTEFKLSVGLMTVCDQVQFGVFEVNEFGLFLLGIVSEYAADGTALVYDKPVPMLVFPMSVGTSWKVDTVAKGPLCNSIFDYNISQTYTSSVDKAGRVRTPYGDFENVLRVNTLMERHLGVGVTATKMRTHTYVTECFSTIASAISEEGESDPDFQTASEVRRLTNNP